MEPSSHIPPDPWNRLADGGLFLLLATTAFALGCQELFDADVWWHVKAGQWILANGSVPRVDPFTFGSAGRPWMDLQWLFEVMLATVFAVGGVRAIVLVTATVGTSVLLVALIARDRRWPSWVIAACWLPALVAMSARFLPRPELLSLLGMAIYLTVLRRTDTKPALAWLLPVVQVLWVNVHALYPLGPFILGVYLIDRAARRRWKPASASERTMPEVARRWWLHLGGATVLAALACLANPYGLRGVLFPLELVPKITAWGGMYKSYVSEFVDFRDYVQNQGIEAAGGNPFVLAECFLLWMLPLGFIVPAVWRIGRASGSRVRRSSHAMGWLLAFGAATGLVLTSTLGLPGARMSIWHVRLGEYAPLGLFALGLFGAMLGVRASPRGVSLSLFGGAAECAWILWLRSHVFGHDSGLLSWLGATDSSVFEYATLFLGVVTTGLLLRARERPFRIILAIVFGYLALQAIRNINVLGLAAGFVLSWSLGEWFAELVACLPDRQGRRWSYWAIGLSARVLELAVIGIVIFTILSGRFFRTTQERRRFGITASPLAYAHEATRFAGRSGLPDHAVVFSLAQAGIYVFHNGPERKPFLDGRLEVPSRTTFETYVRLNQRLQSGAQGWSDVLRRMGDPLILLDHERNFGAEATLLVDPEWRCVYFDALASVFLARRQGHLETAFPSVDFAARHFRDPAWRAIPPEPWGLAEAWGLHSVGSTLRLRGEAPHDSTPPLRLVLALVVCDRIRDALALDRANVSHWSVLGDSCWNIASALGLTAPAPGELWEPARGLLPAQAAFCYRRALEINPRAVDAQRSLSQAFLALKLSDAQDSLIGREPGTGYADRVTDDRDTRGARDHGKQQPQVQDDPSTDWSVDADGLSRTISTLLREGRAEAATRMLAEGENRGIRVVWTTSDRAATVLLYLGRPVEAHRIWERTTDPPSAAVRLAHLGASELARMDFAAAEKTYRAALALDAGLGETWLGLALLHAERGDADEALSAARGGLKRALTSEQRSFLRAVEVLAAPYAERP
jgi:hypothetical protein